MVCAQCSHSAWHRKLCPHFSSSGGIKKEADEVLTACRGLVGGASRGPDSERDVNQLSSFSHTQTYLDQADSKSGFHLN